MPNYSESESKGLREKFEKIVLQWPDVEKKMLFGSPSYTTRGTSFAMLVTGGFILTQADEDRKAALLAEPEADYFVGHGRVMKKWVVVRIQIRPRSGGSSPSSRRGMPRPPRESRERIGFRFTRADISDGASRPPDAAPVTSTAIRRRRARRGRPRSPR